MTFSALFMTRFTSGLLSFADPPPSALWVSLGLGYLAVGAAVAWRLARAGYSAGTSVSGFACWPLLLGLLHEPRAPEACGPGSSRISACMGSLRQTLAEPAAAGLAAREDVDALERALYLADRRVALADRMLEELSAAARGRVGVAPSDDINRGLEALRAARDHAIAELDAVLDAVLQLRIQVGLRTLAGGRLPVQERLQDLQARVAALAELSSLELACAS